MSETHRDQEAAVRSSASDVSADLNEVPAERQAAMARLRALCRTRLKGFEESTLLCEFEDLHFDLPELNSQRGYVRDSDRHYRTS
jgi:hypothetical protein